MKVSKQEIKHLARLARIHLSEYESDQVSKKLSDILNYMSKLKEIDEPAKLTSVSRNQSENIFRKDYSSDRVSTQDALSRSPDPDKEFFRVPKVIG